MKHLSIEVVDSSHRPVAHTNVDVQAQDGTVRRTDAGTWQADDSVTRLTIRVRAPGYDARTHSVALREAATPVVIGLARAGERSYACGDSVLCFPPDERSFLVRAIGADAPRRFEGLCAARGWSTRAVFESRDPNLAYARMEGGLDQAARIVADLAAERIEVDILRVIEHGDAPPLGLANDMIVRFDETVSRAEADNVARSLSLRITRSVRHAGNAFVFARDGLPRYDILDDVSSLNAMPHVRYAEPTIVVILESDAYVPNDPLWAQVPYLQAVTADVAWDELAVVSASLRGGSPDITIAVVDDVGVSVDHPELTAVLTDGSTKLLASWNFASSTIAQETAGSVPGDHGTQCAATATAAFDDGRGLPGVAPNCHLLGARVANAMSERDLADVFLWVGGFLNGSTRNGFPTAPPARAADVVSISWGVSARPLSNEMKDCFDFLTTYGRGGKGCVVAFSIGNTGFTSFTSGVRLRAWAAYPRTLGVGSCIGNGPTNPVRESAYPDPSGATQNIPVKADTRTLYSPYGSAALRKPDLVAPSSTAMFQDSSGNVQHVDAIMSAVRKGTGSVNGCTAGVCNDYARTFGGTSCSTPIVAGAVALMLSARPALTWIQVRDILRSTCVRIDTAASGIPHHDWVDLDGNGAIDFSEWYGAGRLAAGAAVAMALDAGLATGDTYVRENLADTGDVPSSGVWCESPDIWVRRDATEAIPALAWGSAPPHQSPMRGQDNAVFCRVRNRGGAPVSGIYLRAMVAHWPGLEFEYPRDFEAHGAPAASITQPGTFLLGEILLEGIASGADRIVKFIWPQAAIPPATVNVNGTSVQWHPCLLVEASPHDGPWDASAPGVPVQRDSNIAQRNIAIVDPGTPEPLSFVGVMAGSDDGVESILLRGEDLRGNPVVRLRAGDEALGHLLAGHQVPVDPSALRDGVEIACPLEPGHYALLLVSLTGGAGGTLHVTQRRRDQRIAAGFAIALSAAR